MELPPSSDYTDMGRMSKSPGRNNPNNTAAIVARPGLKPAPTSTSLPPTPTHTLTNSCKLPPAFLTPFPPPQSPNE